MTSCLPTSLACISILAPTAPGCARGGLVNAVRAEVRTWHCDRPQSGTYACCWTKASDQNTEENRHMRSRCKKSPVLRIACHAMQSDGAGTSTKSRREILHEFRRTAPGASISSIVAGGAMPACCIMSTTVQTDSGMATALDDAGCDTGWLRAALPGTFRSTGAIAQRRRTCTKWCWRTAEAIGAVK